MKANARKNSKSTRGIIACAWLGLAVAGAVTGVAQDTREQAVAGLRKVELKEMDPTYTQPAPFAQHLVDQELARHPEVILMAIHATPSGHKNVIVASNFGRIGKIGDEDDMRCIRTGKSNLEVNETGKHFEVELVLQDKAGATVGALAVVVNYKPGDDKKALEQLAVAIRDDMRQQIPAKSALFGPAR